MIKLSRLNGFEIVLNPELIEWIESKPDTIISMATGSTVVVKESLEEVVAKVMDYRKSLSSSGKSPVEKLLKSYKKEVI